MKNMMIAVAVLGAIGVGAYLFTHEQKNDVVKIGFMTTLSGKAGIIGKQMQNAVELAFEHKGG